MTRETIPPEGQSTSEVDQDYLARLREALNRMPHRRRGLFICVRVQGLSYSEAAAAFEVSEVQAKRQVSRAMLDLRRVSRPQDFTIWQRLRPRSWHLLAG